MEKPQEYPSIRSHFPGSYYLFAINRGNHANSHEITFIRDMYGDKCRHIDTIPGNDLHACIKGWDIDVYETELFLHDGTKGDGKNAKVAITCFHDPRAVHHIPADQKFHDGINHHIFVLNGKYDRADMVEALCVMLA